MCYHTKTKSKSTKFNSRSYHTYFNSEVDSIVKIQTLGLYDRYPQKNTDCCLQRVSLRQGDMHQDFVLNLMAICLTMG